MLGRKMEDMLMGWIAQERASLHAAPQSLGAVWNVTPLGDEPADRKAPVGIKIIHHPIIALHRRQLLHDVCEMGGPIRTGAGLPKMPHELARRDDEGGQDARAPWRMYSCSRFSGLPGCTGWVGCARCKICIPVFSSAQITTRPCW